MFPEENMKLLRLVRASKIYEARKHYYRWFLPWNVAGFYENWQWAHKYALKLMGIVKSDAMAAPQTTGEDYHKAEVEALLRHLGKIT